MKIIGYSLILGFLMTLLCPSASTAQLSSEEWIHWQLLDFQQNNVYGISVNKAYKELLKGKESHPVIVAVIDEGVDITVDDLQGHIWTNVKETPGNGVDDDHNGYIDDVHGWNFLGGKDGRNIYAANSEADREYARLLPQFGYSATPKDSLEPKGYAYFLKVRQEHRQDSVNRKFDRYPMAKKYDELFAREDSLLEVAAPGKKWYYADIKSFQTKDSLLAANQKAILNLYEHNSWYSQPYYKTISFDSLVKNRKGLSDGLKRDQLAYAQVKDDPFVDRKDIIGDNPFDIKDAGYGNNNVSDEVYGSHGTACSGIISAIRGNGIGMDGVADNVLIMPIRAVNTLHYGDENDKDIALAIRYAVDNGARVISMSFGKTFSPHKQWVDSAIMYAEQKGVLLVHAAGNAGADIDTTGFFPSADYLDSPGHANNMLNVGSTSADTGYALVSSYSNYGQKTVDLFAPGEFIYVPIPDNKYEFNSGTSFSAPVVAGVAALILEYYPHLTAVQLKEILMRSVTPLKGKLVYRPSSKVKVDFATLCVSGGVVNAYNALKLASAY